MCGYLCISFDHIHNSEFMKQKRATLKTTSFTFQQSLNMMTALDTYAATALILLNTFLFVIGFMTVYGWKRLFNDIRFWANLKQDKLAKYCLLALAYGGPVVLLVS